MNRRIIAGILSIGMFTALCATGCGDDRGSGAGYLFNYALVGNPQSLDPQLATDASSKIILGNMMQGLFALDETGNVTNGMAASHTVSEDGRTYTVTLRKDCYWYSKADAAADEPVPQRVKAADYVFAFRRIFDPSMQSPYRDQFLCLANAQEILAGSMSYEAIGVSAPDEDTVVFTLGAPDANFLTLLTTTAALPCNQAFFESCKGRYGRDEDSVISNGAFYVKMWFYDPYGKDNQMQMKRNTENSHDVKVYPSNLVFYIEKTQEDAIKLFSDKKTDCLITDQSRYAGDSNYSTTAYASNTLGLIFNPADPQYANADLRAALALGLSRADYRGELSADLKPAYAVVPPAVTLLNKSYRELVAEGSFAREDANAAQSAYQRALSTLGISALDSVKILVPAGMMDYTVLHTVVRRWSDLFGFYIGIEEVAQSDYDARLQSGDYAIALYALSGPRNGASAVLRQFATEQERFGTSDAAKTQLTTLLDTSDTVASLNESVETFRQAEDCVLQDNCFVPLFYKQEYLVYRVENEDIRFDPFTDQVFFRDAKHFD